MQAMKISNFWRFLFGFISLSITSLAVGQTSAREDLIEGGLVISSPENGQAVATGRSITVIVEPAGSFDAKRVMLLSKVTPAYSPSLRSETLSGAVAGVFRDRVHRRRTCLSGEDARPSETPQMWGLTASQ